MSTVVGYIRPPGPAGEPGQAELALRRYAQTHGCDLLGVHVDPAAQTGGVERRKGFAAVIADLAQGRADHVLILGTDHLSWHPDVRDILSELVTGAGGSLLIADRPR
jgi:DNA invertase Pin-like site-specific DNA recombinase